VIFLNRPIGASPEDDLLLQIQGVIAEYERAQISNRGYYAKKTTGNVTLISSKKDGPSPVIVGI
jgi:site-specific DNA recombinase